MVGVGSDCRDDDSGGTELSGGGSCEVSLRYGVTTDGGLRYRQDMSAPWFTSECMMFQPWTWINVEG